MKLKKKEEEKNRFWKGFINSICSALLWEWGGFGLYVLAPPVTIDETMQGGEKQHRLAHTLTPAQDTTVQHV
jgi:hypothetical protein